MKFLLQLTFFDPEKQIKIFQRFPIDKVDGQFLFNPPHEVPLHESTRAFLLKKDKPSVWDLIVCHSQGDVPKELWYKISNKEVLYDLYHLDGRCLVKFLPLEQLTRIAQLSNRSDLKTNILNALLTDPKPHSLQDVIPLAVQLYKDGADIYKSTSLLHVFAVFNALGSNVSTWQLNQLWDRLCNWEDFSDINFEWSEAAFEELFQDMRNTSFRAAEALSFVLLHLMRHYPDRQLRILEILPLGRNYIWHDRHLFSRQRFKYAELHPEILTDLLKKQDPSIWDLIFCIRQCKSEDERTKAKKKLAEKPKDEVIVATFDLNYCRDSSCQTPFRCWKDSPARIIRETVPAEILQYPDGEELEKDPSLQVYKLPQIHLPNPAQAQMANLMFYTLFIKQLQIPDDPWQEMIIPQKALELVERLLVLPDWYYDVSKIRTGEVPMLFKFPPDIFNCVVRSLHPVDRIGLSRVCRGLYHRICGDAGASIWENEGSIGAVRRFYELYKWINETKVKQKTKTVLALAWPVHYWPKSREFK